MMASTSLRLSITVLCTISNKEPFFTGNSRSTLSNSFRPLQAAPPRSTVLCFSGSRRGERATPSVSSKKTNKKKPTQKIVEENEDVDEDAFEALFQLLEEDLKNDELNGNDGGDDDDEISEEELAKLEQELAEALAEDDELFGAFESLADAETKNDDEEKGQEDEGDDDDHHHENESEVDDEYDEDEEEEEEEGPIKLKSWQLRRLGYALKNGRRKTSIKNLAADLCLDRAIVLKLLRDPPPNLVMLSASLPDKPVTTVLEPVEAVPLETMTEEEAARPQVEEKLPVHAMQSNWTSRKRLKKVHLETLEQVYRRTKRPTNAMISSIVHVTKLPRKKVVKWFKDKRGEEGIPEERVPYHGATTESVFTS